MQLHNSRMQNQQTAQQQGALGTYNAAYQAATAQPGAALAKVLAIDPLAAKQIQDQAKGDPDAADGMARVWASEVGNQAYQYTGRKPVTGNDGISRDPFNQRPILGQTPIGMSAEKHAAYLESLATPVDTGAAAQAPARRHRSRQAVTPQSATHRSSARLRVSGASEGAPSRPRDSSTANLQWDATWTSSEP